MPVVSQRLDAEVGDGEAEDGLEGDVARRQVGLVDGDRRDLAGEVEVWSRNRADAGWVPVVGKDHRTVGVLKFEGVAGHTSGPAVCLLIEHVLNQDREL